MNTWLYPSGKIYCILSQDKRTYFYEDGTLKTVEPYFSQKLHGDVLLYWPNGELKRKCQFQHGVPEEDQMWDENGQRMS